MEIERINLFDMVIRRVLTSLMNKWIECLLFLFFHGRLILDGIALQ